MDIRKVIVFCADGDTGTRLTQLLRWSRREVIAVVRDWADPAPLEKYDAEIAIADPTDRDQVERVFADIDPDGVAVPSARVGYLVETPDGSRRKRMCVGMGGGYGADLDLSTPGAYIVKSKLVMKDKKIMDQFNYVVRKEM